MRARGKAGKAVAIKNKRYRSAAMSRKRIIARSRSKSWLKIMTKKWVASGLIRAKRIFKEVTEREND